MFIIALLGVVVSMLIIWRSCDAFEAATGYLGRNLSDGVRGATFNAIGSSLPELLTTAAALLFYADKSGFAFGIGTTAGSAMFNSAIIPSLVIFTVIVTGLTTIVTVSRKVILRDGLSLLACEFGLIYILTSPTLYWYHGLMLIGMYIAYIVFMLSTMSKSEPEEYEDVSEDGVGRLKSMFTLNIRNWIIGGDTLDTKKSWLLLLVSTAFIGGACHILVESCYAFGQSLNIETYFIAVILAAAATSVPDTIISIKDAQDGNYDDAVANALGSNIFDICVCLGLPLFIYCLATGGGIELNNDNAGNIAELRVLLLLMTAIVFVVLLKGGLKMLHAIILFSVYILFLVYIILSANNNQTVEYIGNGMQKFLTFIGG